MKRLLTTTAMGLLLMTAPALAQTSQDRTPSDQTQTQNAPDTQSSQDQNQMPGQAQDQTEMQKPTAQPDAATKTDKLAEPRMSEPASQHILASKLIGQTVTNVRGENVGEINDLVVGSDGQIASVIVGVGGFLGLGEKDVAIAFADLQFSQRDNDTLVIVAMTQEELEALPAYKSAETSDQTLERPANESERSPAQQETLPSQTEKQSN